MIILLQNNLKIILKYFLLIICIFLFTNSQSYSQTIHVMTYDYETTKDCIEDFIVKDPAEYTGSYSFIHFGTDFYAFSLDNGKPSLNWNFISLNNSDSAIYKNIKIEKNRITATDNSGNKFKARFVKLKCDLSDYLTKGFKGLLVNEELFYILETE